MSASIGSLKTGATSKVQVMVLGVYHFANPKADYVKTELDDHTSAKRQKEIQEVVDRLAKYRLTKIMIERKPEDGANDRYHAYLNGTYTLTVNEVDQLGMRLAKQLGHKDIYPVDWQNGMDFDPVMKFAGENDPHFMSYFNDTLATFTKALSDLQNHSVRENLLFLNNQENLRKGLEIYVRMLRLNDGKDFPGADLVSGWYTRNMHIFGIMAKAAEPGDRVLVIIGNGHAPVLRHLIEMSGDMELVEPNKFLKG